MDEYDKLSQQITHRIDYERRLRNSEYLKREDEMKQQYGEEKMLLSGHGVDGKYQLAKEQLDREYVGHRERDEKIFQGYWDSLGNGTYKEQIIDKERQEKIERTEKRLGYLADRYHFYGKAVPDDIMQALKKEVGHDVLSIAIDSYNQKKTAEIAQEKARMDKITQDKLEYRKQKETRERVDIFELAKQELLKGQKR